MNPSVNQGVSFYTDQTYNKKARCVATTTAAFLGSYLSTVAGSTAIVASSNGFLFKTAGGSAGIISNKTTADIWLMVNLNMSQSTGALQAVRFTGTSTAFTGVETLTATITTAGALYATVCLPASEHIDFICSGTSAVGATYSLYVQKANINNVY